MGFAAASKWEMSNGRLYSGSFSMVEPPPAVGADVSPEGSRRRDRRRSVAGTMSNSAGDTSSSEMGVWLFVGGAGVLDGEGNEDGAMVVLLPGVRLSEDC